MYVITQYIAIQDAEDGTYHQYLFPDPNSDNLNEILLSVPKTNLVLKYCPRPNTDSKIFELDSVFIDKNIIIEV